MKKLKPYRVQCSASDCSAEALYKIAAAWTDGTLVELKPYAFACAEHLNDLYAMAQEKRRRCRLSPGETLEPVGIYELDPKRGDRELVRRRELERKSQEPD